VVEKVCVTGWRVEIHLKIPLPNEPPPDEDRPDHRPSGPDPTPGPPRPKPPSSDLRLRSDHRAAARGHPTAADPAPARPLASLNDEHLPAGIDTEEIISTVNARRAPMMHASAGLAL